MLHLPRGNNGRKRSIHILYYGFGSQDTVAVATGGDKFTVPRNVNPIAQPLTPRRSPGAVLVTSRTRNLMETQ